MTYDLKPWWRSPTPVSPHHHTSTSPWLLQSPTVWTKRFLVSMMFSSSILEDLSVYRFTIDKNISKVKATAGDTHTLVEMILIIISSTTSSNSNTKTRNVLFFFFCLCTDQYWYYYLDLSSNVCALHCLCTACEHAKRTLSSATQTSIKINSLFVSVNFYTSLTHAHFEEPCQNLFQSTLDPVEMELRNSKIDKSNVHEIILVSASTHIPHISNLNNNSDSAATAKVSYDTEELWQYWNPYQSYSTLLMTLRMGDPRKFPYDCPNTKHKE